MQSVYLKIFGKSILIKSQNKMLLQIVKDNYGQFVVPENNSNDLQYLIEQKHTGEHYLITRDNEAAIPCKDLGMFVYNLEKDLTITLELLCSSLFFMHGAALEKNGNILVLTGRSGAGKSTTTWGLLNNGFNYLSDELAPINLQSMNVTPYPHAVCLKKDPPLYPLPAAILKTNRTMHVPANLLPCDTHLDDFPLKKILIVEYSAGNKEPELTELSQAEACMHIYTNGLNQLAHDNDGLAAASKIAAHCECYRLDAAQLDKTCELIATLF